MRSQIFVGGRCSITQKPRRHEGYEEYVCRKDRARHPRGIRPRGKQKLASQTIAQENVIATIEKFTIVVLRRRLSRWNSFVGGTSCAKSQHTWQQHKVNLVLMDAIVRRIFALRILGYWTNTTFRQKTVFDITKMNYWDSAPGTVHVCNIILVQHVCWEHKQKSKRTMGY